MIIWGNKRYHSLNEHLRKKFNQKIIKVSLDAGFSCPNRDGTLGKTGCIFCSDRGSGDFAGHRLFSLKEQFAQVRDSLKGKWPEAKYIAHFQAFTNTYAPIEVLRAKYEEALSLPDIVGLAIATRPDCLSKEVLALLSELNKRTYIFIELGLQTMHDLTARLIHRGYDLKCFENAVYQLHTRGIEVVNHLIFGLPGETREDILSSVRYTASLPIDGIKLQLLYVVKNTALADLYAQGGFQLLEQEEYIRLIVDALEILPPEMVVHRLTGDGPKDLLVGPSWSKNKRMVLNGIEKELIRRDSYQSKYFKEAIDLDT